MRPLSEKCCGLAVPDLSLTHLLTKDSTFKSIRPRASDAREDWHGGDAGRLHQQYLAKNPFCYRCHANTGVKFPECLTPAQGRQPPHDLHIVSTTPDQSGS